MIWTPRTSTPFARLFASTVLAHAWIWAQLTGGGVWIGIAFRTWAALVLSSVAAQPLPQAVNTAATVSKAQVREGYPISRVRDREPQGPREPEPGFCVSALLFRELSAHPLDVELKVGLSVLGESNLSRRDPVAR